MTRLTRLKRLDGLIRDLIPPGSTVLCAVSGGIDSVCLLMYLYFCRLTGGYTLAAAHYNHHLRGAESDRDEAFVRQLVARHCAAWAEAPGVELFTGGGDVAGEARRRKQGIEQTAREMRYAFLRETAAELGDGTLIATAHTADDNAETLLLHLVRGTGLQGLTGIPLRSGKVIRPLLTTTRRDIEAYMAHSGIPHVEDSSNQDLSYTRNRIRAQVMPVLRELNPSFSSGVAATAAFLREDNDYLNAQAAEISGQARWEGERLCIPAALIARAPQPIAVRVIRQLIARFNGGCWDCTAAHLEEAAALCRRDAPSAKLCLPRGLTVRREYGLLVLSGPAPPGPQWAAFSPAAGDNPIPGTGWTLRLGTEPWPGLTVRPRQTGDEITLPGQPRRSLKKLFIDQKVPRLERGLVPVLADAGGVLAVAGFGPNTAHPRHGDGEFLDER